MKKPLAFNWRLLAVPLLVFLALPILTLLLRTSPERVAASLQQEQVVQAISISFKTTLISLVFTILFGTPVAYLMGRLRIPASNAWWIHWSTCPPCCPRLSRAWRCWWRFGRQGLLGKWLDMRCSRIAFTPVAVVLAQAFVSAPYYIQECVHRLFFRHRQIGAGDLGRRGQAHMAGLSAIISVPLGGLAEHRRWSGAELGARAGRVRRDDHLRGQLSGRTQTMPLAIYMGFELDMDLAITLSVILVAVSFVSLINR